MSKQQKEFIKALLSLVFWLAVAYLIVAEPAFGIVGAIMGMASLVWGKIKNKPIVTFKIRK
ncbi:hypothetical protein [Blautia marasmi]|uniref:hypothetical protein n=1 Tax=Blautia marasmi TaxID=1917868 RepID=UPI00204A2355|nr:hypothetical protein [uncultured Blautia sp.]DAL33409.1 MAG TPA_asm: hypothetical protein [Caudoviricetes sp.]